ncbi:Hypothetical protein, putative [Bodo saltans]|uniref:Uncharacterized protein n=1 Tax=Bodo saltans TaxID=75058 RepID=A0A0S4JJT5_BODSA|nr:Hypothetical protein, putative [Bodo saltans]|eukprot:CUG90618.1 Hypothetical protein, putative [Bodo saltans]
MKRQRHSITDEAHQPKAVGALNPKSAISPGGRATGSIALSLSMERSLAVSPPESGEPAPVSNLLGRETMTRRKSMRSLKEKEATDEQQNLDLLAKAKKANSSSPSIVAERRIALLLQDPLSVINRVHADIHERERQTGRIDVNETFTHQEGFLYC